MPWSPASSAFSGKLRMGLDHCNCLQTEDTVLEARSVPHRGNADRNAVIARSFQGTEISCCFFHLHQHCKAGGLDVWLSADASPRLGISFVFPGKAARAMGALSLQEWTIL